MQNEMAFLDDINAKEKCVIIDEAKKKSVQD
jgi:hypothetical protein